MIKNLENSNKKNNFALKIDNYVLDFRIGILFK